MTAYHIQSETGDMIIDDRHAPVFFTNNRGTWTVAQMEKWYQVRTEIFLESIRKGNKVFHIGNLTTTATPDAVLRQQIGEFQVKYDVEFMHKENWIGQCYIIPNPIMRGFITAVQWMAGEVAAPATTASDLEGALKIATKAYAKYGLEMPPVPHNYEFVPYQGDLPRRGIPRGGINYFVK